MAVMAPVVVRHLVARVWLGHLSVIIVCHVVHYKFDLREWQFLFS